MGLKDLFNKKDSKGPNLVDEAKVLVNSLNQTHKLEAIDSPILLPKYEKLYLYEDKVEFGEEKSVRVNRGGGVGFRVARGIYLHSGTSKGRYLPELRKSDVGVLYITNKRIVYGGRFGFKNYQIDKILSVNTFRDAIQLEGVASKAPYFFVRSPQKWKIVITIISQVHDLNKLPQIDLEVQ